MVHKDRLYKGKRIRPCVSVVRGKGKSHNGRWIVQTYREPTGTPYSDEFCPHYQSLADAKASIRENLAEAQRSFLDKVAVNT